MGTAGVNNESQQSKSPVCVPNIMTVDIDLDRLESVRERMPIQQHRGSSTFS